jgi:hypothetical protein
VGKRALLIAVACAAILLAGGLIHHAKRGNDKHAAATTAAPVTIAPASTLAARGKMSVDGQEADARGSCSAPADGRSVNISLSGAPPNKINVTLDKAQPPNVTFVVLASTGMAFMYQPGTEGSAQATNDGNTYHISGTLLRYGFVSRTFDITVTCS